MNGGRKEQRNEGDAILELAGLLREGETPISPHVPDSPARPFHRSFVLEAVREGYLLHYGEPRLLAGHDEDLALLAGDYLYALGLERLAALGDLEAISELADLISLSAQLHDPARGEAPAVAQAASSLWLASVTAVAAGTSPGHEQGKTALREERPEASSALWQAASKSARQSGLEHPLERAAEAIGFADRQDLPA
jgi:hypothetical protein